MQPGGLTDKIHEHNYLISGWKTKIPTSFFTSLRTAGLLLPTRACSAAFEVLRLSYTLQQAAKGLPAVGLPRDGKRSTGQFAAAAAAAKRSTCQTTALGLEEMPLVLGAIIYKCLVEAATVVSGVHIKSSLPMKATQWRHSLRFLECCITRNKTKVRACRKGAAVTVPPPAVGCSSSHCHQWAGKLMRRERQHLPHTGTAQPVINSSGAVPQEPLYATQKLPGSPSRAAGPPVGTFWLAGPAPCSSWEALHSSSPVWSLHVQHPSPNEAMLGLWFYQLCLMPVFHVGMSLFSPSRLFSPGNTPT